MNNRHFVSKIWDADIANPDEKFVLVALARNATQDGIVRASVASLIKHTSLDELNVFRAIHTLNEQGWLHYQIGTTPNQGYSDADTFLADILTSEDKNVRARIDDVIRNEPWFFCVNRMPVERTDAFSNTTPARGE